MTIYKEDIDIERAAHDPIYRRKVIAALNSEPVKSPAAADPTDITNQTTND